MRRGWGAIALASVLTLSTNSAFGFCGFYVSGSSEQLTNRATRVALMRRGTRTVLTMSNDYEGPPQDFAMVVPVPVVLQQENVRTLPMNVFDRIEQLTAPRLVEYWERDPCFEEVPEREFSQMEGGSGTRHAGSEGAMGRRDAVHIEAQFVVGEYEVVVLSATESDALETWLREHQYNIPRGASEALAPYVREGWKFFVARVNVQRVQRRPDGSAKLSPLRFHYDTPEFRLPVRLGLLNAPTPSAGGASAAQDLIVYLLHDRNRHEVANYPNVFIPTNLDVSNDVRTQFGAFYAALFDRTLQAAGGRAVVTEYSWSAGSCDPCPTPALGTRELQVLGLDVLPALPQEDPSWTQGRAWAPTMVLTRLHTRYDRNTLSEDLVFREAPAVTGGREFTRGAHGGLEEGAQPAPEGINNFQARYAIRHPWTGRIACSDPQRNIWAGPPHGERSHPTAATELARVQRTAIDIASVVYTPIRELRIHPVHTRPTGTFWRDPTQDQWLLRWVMAGLGALTLGLLVQFFRMAPAKTKKKSPPSR